jgi:hypothetical protein
MPKTKVKPDTYQVGHERGLTFPKAAATAIDQALRSREDVTITEFSPEGKLRGYIYVTATNESVG